jgi:hypothetical protein
MVVLDTFPFVTRQLDARLISSTEKVDALRLCLKINQEKTMKPMTQKLRRVGILCLIALNLLVAAPSIFAGDKNTLLGKVEVTFTKWVTDWPNMAGLVSGDVGGGTFAGEVLNYNHTDAIDTIEALYHINGRAPHFTAHVNVTQDNLKGTAVIDGIVTDGSLKGGRVQGEYQVISPCGIINAQNGSAGDVCFQGTLVVRPSSGN